jgi:hypothetical protein
VGALTVTTSSSDDGAWRGGSSGRGGGRGGVRRAILKNQMLMEMWGELKQIASSIHKKDEDDTIICHFSSLGRYSIQSIDVVINDKRGASSLYSCDVENSCTT